MTLELGVEGSQSLAGRRYAGARDVPAKPGARRGHLSDGARLGSSEPAAAWRWRATSPGSLAARGRRRPLPASSGRSRTGRWLSRLVGARSRGRLHGGPGSDGLPAYRSFVLGGRGTLVGEPFRAYGGRAVALAQLEWRFEVPAPAIPLGSFASTGRQDDPGALPRARAGPGGPSPGCPGPRPTAFGRWLGWPSSGSCGSSGSRPEWDSGTAMSGSPSM